MSGSLVVLSATNIRKQLIRIARNSLDTVVIERMGKPVAIYRPLTEAEEQAQLDKPTLPMIPISQVTMQFGLTRRQLEAKGGQAIVYRITPDGFRGGQQQSYEEVLGV